MLNIHDGPSLDMDRAEDRDCLRRALASLGIAACDTDLGGSLRALEVVLVPDDGREALSVLVGSMDAPCEVSLSGFRTQGRSALDCASAGLVRPETVAQVADAVLAFWTHREVFILDFRAGAYDLV